MPKLLIVIASVREGRIGKPIADWFVERAAEHGGWDIEVADLKEIALPLHDEPHHPQLQLHARIHEGLERDRRSRRRVRFRNTRVQLLGRAATARTRSII